ncbi:hypothetical protein [Gynuella sunshinyii]|uniref:Uncharacterized protein n=1 Tax=Gynuella sunshinyii YC6258 TaxID=1445510 RepID=A0A0C5VTC9_9GAMM|nr:hypothetical protein [Gynuella sunshinyii]AJQ96573.1 hypothetical Protein YC6258_04541 [Gynuella sunshinyii YC6258]
MTTESTPNSCNAAGNPQLELIKRDLCATITMVNGGQAIALMLAESDDENAASIARMASGFLEHLSLKMDGIHAALSDIK